MNARITNGESYQWPTQNEIKRIGSGLASVGRVFQGISTNDLHALVGDILTDASPSYNCIKLLISEASNNGPHRTVDVELVTLTDTTYPVDCFSGELLEPYLRSYFGKYSKGKPIAIYFEACGTFTEIDPETDTL